MIGAHSWASGDDRGGKPEPPNIFISHSTRSDEPAAVCALSLIEHELTAAGYAPIIDRKLLKAADDYAPILKKHLMRCHGFVVLVSRAALDSSWVRQEVEIALARWTDSDQSMPVVAVVLPGIRAQDIEGSELGATNLLDLQLCWLTADAELPQDVLAALEPLQIRYGVRPLRALEDAVSGYLRASTRNAQHCAASHLAIAVAPHREDQLADLLAMELLSASYDQVSDVVRELAGRIEQNAGLALVEIVVPFALVPETTAVLVATARRSLPRLVTTLGAERVDTAQIYLRRSCSTPQMWHTYTPAPCGAADGYGTELAAEIRGHLIKHLHLDPDGKSASDVDDAEIRGALNYWEANFGPIVIIVNLRPDEDLLDRLVRAFPTLVFLFLTGQDKDNVPSDFRNQVVQLKPTLQPIEERRLLSRFKILRSAFT